MRRTFVLKLFIFASLLLMTATSAFGGRPWRTTGSLRCDGRIVYRGETSFEVVTKCGEPTWVNFYEEERVARDFYDPFLFERWPPGRVPLFVRQRVLVEEWIYNLGPTKFIRYLTFENGRLVNIKTGRYGY